jgi:N utilization substance protein A
MNLDFVQALRDIAQEKGIPLEKLEQIIEAALESAYRKHYGSAGEIHVEIDWDESRMAVYSRKQVVLEVQNPHVEMSLADAKALDASIDIGDSLDIEVTPEDFGRIAAQTAKQVVVQRIREAERELIFEEFSEREGEVVTGVVQRREGRSVFINIGRAESLLPPSEQMPLDGYRFGERIKVFVVEVKRTTRQPHVLVSRTHPGLVRRLFELEVPEIHDGVVEIKAVAREAGARTKVAVSSRQANVDPVGACVGHRGSRVQAVVDELRGEKIDIVRWSDDMARYLASALSPAKVNEVYCDDQNTASTVVVPDNQLSLAIGRDGQNVRLAARLTGWRIDIRSESQMRELAAAERQARAQAAAPEAETPAGEAPAEAEAPAEQAGAAPEQEVEAAAEAGAAPQEARVEEPADQEGAG